MKDPQLLRHLKALAWLGLLLCAPGLGGCRDAGSEEAAASEGDGGTRYRFVEVAYGSPEAALTSVTSLDVDSDGRLYVVDVMNPYVTVLSSTGDVVRTLGRRGEGPGEFKSVTNVQVLPGDSLLVFDQNLSRVTVFRPASAEVAYVVNLAASTFSAPYRIEKAPRSGKLVAAYQQLYSTADDPSRDRMRRNLLRVLDADGAVSRDSVLTFPASESLVVRKGGGLRVNPNAPFGRKGIFRVGDRIYYNWTDTLGIEIYSLEGTRVGGFSIDREPVEVARSDIREAVSGSSESFHQVLRETAPQTWPVVKDMLLDDQGRVWVSLNSGAGKQVRWLALEASGRRMGWATLPRNVSLLRITGQSAYAVSVDETDSPRVIIFRVVPEPG
jgi:hypothetical protein